MNEEIQQPETRESIKLMKMSKGYNWEFKVFIDKGGAESKEIADIVDRVALNRIKKINDEMVKEYGQSVI